MAFSLKTHEVKTRAGRTISVRSRPYARLTNGDAPPVYVQEGTFYSEGGEKYDPVPDWVPEALEKITSKVRVEVGLDEPTEEKATRRVKQNS